MDVQWILERMTLEEKAAIVSGTDFMYTNSIPRLHIPALCMADGPHGLRKQIGEQDNGIAHSEPATAFPTAAATASSWNPENTRKMGAAIAEECRRYGVHVLLGPGVNIKRNPLCGRNFEYFSEDPLLSAEMGAAQVQGVQSQGVGVSVKHFALNNSENYRFMGDSIADMRAMREVYLKAFERIVKQAKPATIMCAYNQINGTFCSENKWLLTDVLRGEWGFTGAVMTDWGAVRDRAAGLEAGLDLEMPGDTAVCRREIIDGVRNGTLSKEKLDTAARNILQLIHTYVTGEQAPPVDFLAHHDLAAQIAADSAVLMKNDGMLPLDCTEKILVVGDLFEKMRYQGSGSSMICPTQVTSPRMAFEDKKVPFEFVRGYAENRLEPEADDIRQALERAACYDTILVFAGLTDYVESEGGDREHMRLPQNQLALIEALCHTGKKIAVVLFGGSVVELPFDGQVNAILNMFLPGQNGGTAAARLIFGEQNPSGRLAETWPVRYADVPFGDTFAKGIQEIYRESIFVGYRYYLTAHKKVRYPFGYGLSYTTFAYENIRVLQDAEKITVTCQVKNTGRYGGAEVVQLYVHAPESGVFKPVRELRGFTKIYLEPEEQRTVSIEVPLEELRYFHVAENRWILESGEYKFQICSDAQTVRLSSSVWIQGESVRAPYLPQVEKAYHDADTGQMTHEVFEAMSGMTVPPPPPHYPLTLESRFTDLQQSLMGRILFNAVLSVAKKQLRQARKMPEGIEKDNKLKGALFLKRILESNSLRSMSMSAGRSMPYHFACGFMELANGHFLRGIRSFCSPIKVPVLPKEMEENKK